MILSPKQLKGLTLVELLIVLGLIVILAGIAVVVINPAKQRNRAKDGVLQNAISSIGQTFESFYGLKGYYPTTAQASEIVPYIQGFTVNTAVTPVTFYNAAVNTGINVSDAAATNGIIRYYPNDFNGDGIYDLPCLQAYSNVDSARYIAWAPGYGVKELAQSCHTSGGYTELTGITP